MANIASMLFTYPNFSPQSFGFLTKPLQITHSFLKISGIFGQTTEARVRTRVLISLRIIKRSCFVDVAWERKSHDRCSLTSCKNNHGRRRGVLGFQKLIQIAKETPMFAQTWEWFESNRAAQCFDTRKPFAILRAVGHPLNIPSSESSGTTTVAYDASRIPRVARPQGVALCIYAWYYVTPICVATQSKNDLLQFAVCTACSVVSAFSKRHAHTVTPSRAFTWHRKPFQITANVSKFKLLRIASLNKAPYIQNIEETISPSQASVLGSLW